MKSSRTRNTKFRQILALIVPVLCNELTELWTSLTGSEFKRPSLQKALPNRQNDDDQNDDDKQLALMITASEQRCIAK